jgi:hypothetical protein
VERIARLSPNHSTRCNVSAQFAMESFFPIEIVRSNSGNQSTNSTLPRFFMLAVWLFALFLPHVSKDARQAIVRKVNISLTEKSKRIR